MYSRGIGVLMLSVVLVACFLIWTSVASAGLGSAMGTALGEEFGLVPHDSPDGTVITSTEDGIMANGELVDDCTPSDSDDAVAIADMGDFFYCLHGPSELENWVMWQRIIRHEPTQEEIDEMRLALSDIPPPPDGSG
jgi:hypothetical protein